MREWLRRVDPAFYDKEPYLLRTQAQIPRYTEEAQAELRLRVLSDDGILHFMMTIIALLAYFVAIGGGALAAGGDWVTVWAFAVLAVATPRALPWSHHDGKTAWIDALLGVALIAIPAAATRIDLIVGGIALVTGVLLWAARGSRRLVLIVVAIGVLLAEHAHPLYVLPLVIVLTAVGCVYGASVIARVWLTRPQVATWSLFATLMALCAYTFAFDAAAAQLHLPAEIAAIAIAYLGVCVVAGRIRRAQLFARPPGLLSLPQSIVPRLDRSHDHAIICWFV